MTLKIVGTGFFSVEGASQVSRLQEAALAPLFRLVEHAVTLCQEGMTNVSP